MINLELSKVDNRTIRENFQKLQEFLSDYALLRAQFKFFEFSVPLANAEYRLRHGLGFRPKDILISYVSNNSEVRIKWDQTDNQYVVLLIPTDATTVRLYVGLHNGAV